MYVVNGLIVIVVFLVDKVLLLSGDDVKDVFVFVELLCVDG